MKLNDLRKLDKKELEEKLGQTRKELTVLSLSRFSKKEKDLKQLVKKRKEIARILTLIREKELLNLNTKDK